MAPDDASFWAMRTGHPEGRISRYATPVEGASWPRKTAQKLPRAEELAAVTGIDTACAIAVHPGTSELYVTERKSQQILVFPAGGGVAATGRPWGASLKLAFPYLVRQPQKYLVLTVLTSTNAVVEHA